MMIRATTLALSLAFASAPALAAPAADEGAAIVHIGNLDLSTATGQRKLEQRVKSAAQRLCRGGGRGLADYSLELKCVAQIIAATQPKTDRAIAQARGEGRLALLMIPAAQ